ncbi:hypothetical protein ABKW28_18660 [Nocardioides sp. 31GB23]|uniref:hypothetical protein n=1 Tax=Nocardioides sp. 31GB23 TaxID=3156065 RepID=UPI0032AF3648
MSEVRTVVVAEGVAPDGEPWTLHYAPKGDRGYPHHLALFVNGAERESGSGFDVPGTTEIGFGGGLTPGEGNYYLYGLTTSRIRTVRAESHDDARHSEASTAAFPVEATAGGDALRIFVLVRPAIEDVTALVGLDQAGREVQRIPLIGPPERS